MRPYLMAWMPLILLLAPGCGEQRSSADAHRMPEVTFVDQIQPLLQEHCADCHGADSPAGSYALDSWRGVLGPGSDGVERNVRAGDAQSLLLTTVADSADQTHKDLLSAEQVEQLRRWVVDDRLAYFRPSYHPRGWLDPSDRNSQGFHGGALRQAGWSFDGCTGCHGAGLDGGRSGVSCRTCHQQGPTGCDTCHGSGGSAGPPPALDWSLDPAQSRGVGVHAAHLQQSLFGSIGCDDCHRVPTRYDQAGHLFDDAAGRTSDLRAEVRFSPRASLGGVTASYDQATGSCTVACHGAGLSPAAADKPQWTAPATLGCKGCHSVGHPAPNPLGGADCSHCHQQLTASCTPGSDADCVQTADGVGVRLVDPTLHGDGNASLGRAQGQGTCWSCHGTEQSRGAPGPDLAGNTAESEVTVGLHQAHLSDNGFRVGLPCDSCHSVPDSLLAAGHIDSDVPAEVSFSDLATGKARDSSLDLKPSWDRQAATCSNTYCHGLDGGQVQSWSWTQRVSGGPACDSCHGLPPKKTVTGADHPQSGSCVGCHASAYTNGTIDPKRHINGKVDM